MKLVAHIADGSITVVQEKSGIVIAVKRPLGRHGDAVPVASRRLAHKQMHMGVNQSRQQGGAVNVHPLMLPLNRSPAGNNRCDFVPVNHHVRHLWNTGVTKFRNQFTIF